MRGYRGDVNKHKEIKSSKGNRTSVYVGRIQCIVLQHFGRLPLGGVVAQLMLKLDVVGDSFISKQKYL